MTMTIIAGSGKGMIDNDNPSTEITLGDDCGLGTLSDMNNKSRIGNLLDMILVISLRLI